MALPPLPESTAVPTVYLDVHSDLITNYVAADNEEQGRAMLRHALACGARHVAVVGEAAFSQLALRVRGICDEARAAGVYVELIGTGDWNSARDGYEQGVELAKRPANERPDFAIGLTDVLAAGLIDGFIAAGLRVPDDMLVAGCDGNPLAWSGSVPLTTIASPGNEIGRRGVRYLMARIAGGEPSAPCDDMVAPQLIVRASTMASRVERSQAPIPDLNLGEYLQ